MKIYTKTGDTGQTGLLGGDRISKNSARIAAIGSIDELNAYVGVCCSVIDDSTFLLRLERIQNQLFDLGAELACLPNSKFNLTSITLGDIAELENEIDEMVLELPPLKEFILPGGCPSSSHVHYLRTICRRTEREILELHAINPIRSEPIIYVNRLSDWLFCFSRLLNHRSQVAERKWTKRENK